MTRLMGLECFSKKMEQSMKDNGKIMLKMDMAFRHGQMEGGMKEIIKQERNTEKVNYEDFPIY